MNKDELESAFNETTDNAVDLLKENVEIKKKYNIMKENAETLAKIINKAIEYIENDKKDKCMEDFKTGIMTRELKILDILKGDDK